MRCKVHSTRPTDVCGMPRRWHPPHHEARIIDFDYLPLYSIASHRLPSPSRSARQAYLRQIPAEVRVTYATYRALATILAK